MSTSTITTSSVVLPSSVPSSGSSEVTETSLTVGSGPASSETVIAASIVRYAWLGGHSTFGERDTESDGPFTSRQNVATGGSWSLAPRGPSPTKSAGQSAVDVGHAHLRSSASRDGVTNI